MFTIDLLKGEGIPLKSRPEGIAIGALAFGVPIIVGIAMFGFYLSNSVAMSIQRQDITKYTERTNKLSEAVKLQESLEKEKAAIGSSLAEVASSVGRHTQWSSVLATLVRNMPDSMVLTKLEMKQRFVKRQIRSKEDPNKKVPISIPARTLQMNVSLSHQIDYDKAVKDFRDRLFYSSFLAPKLENIRVSQGFDTLEGQDVVSYTLDCVFKPGL